MLTQIVFYRLAGKDSSLVNMLNSDTYTFHSSNHEEVCDECDNNGI